MAVKQILDGRYIDGEALLKLLQSLFGASNFTIEYNDDDIILTIPMALTREQQKAVEIKKK